MGNDGELMKAFDIKDGCGIARILIPAGIIPVIITARTLKIVENRCKELGIKELYQGVSDKLGKLQEILSENKGSLGECVYIGDDIIDLECMEAIKEAGGLIGCPADAVVAVKAVANFVSEKNGGDGAVREFIEWLV